MKKKILGRLAVLCAVCMTFLMTQTAVFADPAEGADGAAAPPVVSGSNDGAVVPPVVSDGSDGAVVPAAEQVIKTVDIGNIWKNLVAGTPIAFTGEVNPNSACAGQMELIDEIWSTEGYSIRRSDVDHPAPIDGRTYNYVAVLQAKDGFVFSDAFANPDSYSAGSVTFICDGNHSLPVSWDAPRLSEDKKTLTIAVDGIIVKAAGASGGAETIGIKDVQINAYVAYMAGDAPKASMEKMDQNAANYEVEYEYWEEMEQTGDELVPVKFWYSDESLNTALSDDKKLTTFEEGKHYMYSVLLQATNGRSFVSVGDGLTFSMNGKAIDSRNLSVGQDGKKMFAAALYWFSPKAADYQVINGANSSWIEETDDDTALTIRANGDFAKFTGLQVDGVAVDPSNYTAVSGSTIVTIKPEYLKTLSSGTHTLTFLYTDGSCSTGFSVVKSAGTGGSTAGGSTSGGSTTGGSTTGGSTTGGSTAGRNTSGGSSTGGSTAGGSTTGGSATGGNTTGGSTVGGTATDAAQASPKTGEQSPMLMLLWIAALISTGSCVGVLKYRSRI